MQKAFNHMIAVTLLCIKFENTTALKLLNGIKKIHRKCKLEAYST